LVYFCLHWSAPVVLPMMWQVIGAGMV